MELADIIDSKRYPIGDAAFIRQCRDTLDCEGVLVLPGFMLPAAVAAVRREGLENENQAYFCTNWHNAYLSPVDPEYPENHPRNRQVPSSKGCITDDQIPADSALRELYNAEQFKRFLAYIFDQNTLYPYADTMSSINLHYARTGQELGWHFDESSFSVTLMIQPPEQGGIFEYVGRVRDADNGEMNYPGVAEVLDGVRKPEQLAMEAGALVLFRGRNSIHRVTPNEGKLTRMLVVLAYNSQPGVALSADTQQTFYGRVAQARA